MVAEMQMLKLRLDHAAREPALGFSNTRRISLPLGSTVGPHAKMPAISRKGKAR